MRLHYILLRCSTLSYWEVPVQQSQGTILYFTSVIQALVRPGLHTTSGPEGAWKHDLVEIGRVSKHDLWLVWLRGRMKASHPLGTWFNPQGSLKCTIRFVGCRRGARKSNRPHHIWTQSTFYAPNGKTRVDAHTILGFYSRLGLLPLSISPFLFYTIWAVFRTREGSALPPGFPAGPSRPLPVSPPRLTRFSSLPQACRPRRTSGALRLSSTSLVSLLRHRSKRSSSPPGSSCAACLTDPLNPLLGNAAAHRGLG